VGLAASGRDASDRLRLEATATEAASRQQARTARAMGDNRERWQPLVVETRRGVEQLQRIREVLARLELTDGLTCADLVTATAGRLPRDATVVAVLPAVPEATAIALGSLRRQGLAVTVVLVMLSDEELELAFGRLRAEGIRDVRHLQNEEMLPDLCRQHVQHLAPYELAGP
jgi:hypothetical protein